MNSESVDEKKKGIRETMRLKRKKVSSRLRHIAGFEISRNMDRGPLDLFNRAQTIMTYISGPNEVPMRYFMHRAWRRGKRICVPAYEKWRDAYHAVEFGPATGLIIGKFGIREPAEQIPVPLWELNAIVLPGLAFDFSGGRLGYGGGYFDKILSEAPAGIQTVGIAYDFQVLPPEEMLPQHEGDRKIKWIVTDKRIIDCENNRVVYNRPKLS